MIFNDFYEWINHTIELVERNGMKVGFKGHPNQTAQSIEILEKLKLRHPNIYWIDPNLSNIVILGSSIKFGISVYGTVLHELAYFGKIPICAGDNPHSAFNFIFEAKSILDYDNLVLNFNDLILPPHYKEEVAIFYFMHNEYDKEDYKIDLGIIKDYNVFNSTSALISLVLKNN